LNPGFDNVGVRIPNLPWLLNLIDYLGGEPLALTSANRSGFPSTLDVSVILFLIDSVNNEINN